MEVTVSTRDQQSEPHGGSVDAPLLQIENLTKVFHIRQGFASQDFPRSRQRLDRHRL